MDGIKTDKAKGVKGCNSLKFKKVIPKIKDVKMIKEFKLVAWMIKKPFWYICMNDHVVLNS